MCVRPLPDPDPHPKPVRHPETLRVFQTEHRFLKFIIGFQIWNVTKSHQVEDKFLEVRVLGAFAS